MQNEDVIMLSMAFIENITLDQAYEAIDAAKEIPTPDGWERHMSSCTFTTDYANINFLHIDFYLVGIQGQTIAEWYERAEEEGSSEWTFKAAIENIPYREGCLLNEAVG